MEASESFRWGEKNPEGGFKVGDRVGLIYSDHERYVFDNPEGIVTAVGPVEEFEDAEFGLVTVQVEAEVTRDLVFLIERDGKNYQREEVNG